MSAINDRIRKLLALASNNSNEAEAAAAMAKASALMLEHGLTEAEVNKVASAVGYGDFIAFDKQYEQLVAHAVNELYGTQFVTYRGEGKLTFVGREENVAAAEITYRFLLRQVEGLYKAYLPKRISKSERAAYRRDFKKACAYRLYTRAVQVRIDQQAPSESRALVVQHIENLKQEVSDFLDAAEVKKKAKRSVVMRDSEGTIKGREAAEKVALHQQLKENA